LYNNLVKSFSCAESYLLTATTALLISLPGDWSAFPFA